MFLGAVDSITIQENVNNTLISNIYVFDTISVDDSFVDPEHVLGLLIEETVTINENTTFDSIRYSPDGGMPIEGTSRKITGNT